MEPVPKCALGNNSSVISANCILVNDNNEFSVTEVPNHNSSHIAGPNAGSKTRGMQLLLLNNIMTHEFVAAT